MYTIFKLFVPVLAVLFLPTFSAAGLDDYFVSTEWLAANRDKAVVIDVRKFPLYLLGHIDGAHNLDRAEFLTTRDGVKSLIPVVSDVETLLGRLGVTPETPVVVYAKDDDPYAARLVWTLHSYGHPKSYVLDGGYEKWSQEGHRTAILPTPAPVASLYRNTAQRDLRADKQQILSRIGGTEALIWDTRTAEEHVGTDVRADRGGHIPGATHLNWASLQTEVNGVKVLKNEQELRNLLMHYGIGPEREIVAHCQTGIRSSYATLVLLGLGYEKVRNYDGSWIEWANDKDLPVATIPVTAQIK